MKERELKINILDLKNHIKKVMSKGLSPDKINHVVSNTIAEELIRSDKLKNINKK